MRTLQKRDTKCNPFQGGYRLIPSEHLDALIEALVSQVISVQAARAYCAYLDRQHFEGATLPIEEILPALRKRDRARDVTRGAGEVHRLLERTEAPSGHSVAIPRAVLRHIAKEGGRVEIAIALYCVDAMMFSEGEGYQFRLKTTLIAEQFACRQATVSDAITKLKRKGILADPDPHQIGHNHPSLVIRMGKRYGFTCSHAMKRRLEELEEQAAERRRNAVRALLSAVDNSSPEGKKRVKKPYRDVSKNRIDPVKKPYTY